MLCGRLVKKVLKYVSVCVRERLRATVCVRERECVRDCLCESVTEREEHYLDEKRTQRREEKEVVSVNLFSTENLGKKWKSLIPY